MIDKNKQYRTREGREVRIYATDGYGVCPVHGAIRMDSGWRNCSWSVDGIFNPFIPCVSIDDLVEVKPRIKRTVWLNLYPESTVLNTREIKKSERCSDCLACVKVDIDVEEGEGLS